MSDKARQIEATDQATLPVRTSASLRSRGTLPHPGVPTKRAHRDRWALFFRTRGRTSAPPQRICRGVLAIALAACVIPAHPNEGGERLRAAFDASRPRLERSAFGRPMTIASTESERTVKGEVHALFDYPFGHVKAALDQPGEWCDVLMLPFNSKFCRTASDMKGTGLTLGVGRTEDQPEDARTIAFDFQPLAAAADHFAVRLYSDSGPAGTTDYRILLEAMPVDGKRTFVRFSYEYSYGLAAKLAMQAYLGTSGRDKVGFSVTGRGANGEAEHVRGMRGVMERNAMRYYLAIEAVLHALRFPESERLERRLGYWFDATEQYPRQLREISRSEYMAMKLARQQARN